MFKIVYPKPTYWIRVLGEFVMFGALLTTIGFWFSFVFLIGLNIWEAGLNDA